MSSDSRERKRITSTQKRYRDVSALHGAGVEATPEELARATGREAADFEGVLVAKHSPELEALTNGNERRRIQMAGMDTDGDGLIGLALIARDIKGFLARRRSRRGRQS